MVATRTLTFGILFFCLCVYATIGEGWGGFELCVSAGPSIPLATSRLNSYWAAGPGISGGIGYVVSRNLTFAFAIDYGRYEWDGKFERRFYSDPEPVRGEGSQMLALTGSVMTSIWKDSGRVRPYFAHGAGLFRISFGTAEVIDPYEGPMTQESTSETVLGLIYGMGVDFPVSRRVVVFVEGKYFWAFTGGDQATQIFPIGLGIRLK